MAPIPHDPFRFSSHSHGQPLPTAAAWILVLAGACALFIALVVRAVLG